jgi:hypothetical protein
MPEVDYDACAPGCPNDVCHEMLGELKNIATWLAKEKLTPREFTTAVANFEAKKLGRFGLKLTSAVSENRLAHFTLRFVNSGELCASMDIDPATGEMIIQPGCV